MRRTLAIFILLVYILTPLRADVIDELREKLEWVLKDAEAGFGLFGSENTFTTMAFLSSGTISSMIDQKFRDIVQSNKSRFLKYYTGVTNELGSATYIVPVSIGLYGISLFTNSQKFSDTAFTAFESLEIAMLITGGLKIAAGRARPGDELGSRDFNMFSNTQDSFPSGHTTVAFAFLTPYAEYIGSPYSYILYFLAASTAFARVYKDVHLLSDVIAEAVVGYIVGRSLVRLHKARRSGLDITLSYTKDGRTLCLSYRF